MPWSQRAIVLGFVALASAFSWTVPAWETPDEPAHFAYVIHLVGQGALPVQIRDVFGEEHQAPLYYALAAVSIGLVDLDDTTGRFVFNRSFGWGPGKDVNVARTPSMPVPLRGHELALRMIRMGSVIMAACTVMLTGRLASAITPESPVAVMAMALVAFNPQFLFIGGGVNNDNLLTLCVTGFLLELVRRMSVWPRVCASGWVAVGCWCGAALLAKANALTLLVVLVLSVALRVLRDGRVRTGIRALAIAGITSVAVAGWWFLRNFLLYGDPLGAGPFVETSGLVSSVGWRDLPYVLAVQARSFWGLFGWMSVVPPSGYYVAVVVLFMGFGVVAAHAFVRGGSATASVAERDALAILLCAVVVQEVFQLSAIGSFGESWMQGRYLFPVLPAGAVAASIVLNRWCGRRWAPHLAWATCAYMLGLASYALIGVVAPAYYGVR